MCITLPCSLRSSGRSHPPPPLTLPNVCWSVRPRPHSEGDLHYLEEMNTKEYNEPEWERMINTLF